MELPPASSKRPLEEPDSATPPPSKRAHVDRTRRSHQRQPKPPYSYTGMMVVAIHTSPDQRLTLAEIQDKLQDMFPFFRGEYRGWKDSLRHFLSHTPCFVQVHRTKTKTSKGNFWTVDLSLVSRLIFNKVKGAVQDGQHWAPTLTEHLQIPDIPLPAPRTPPVKKSRSKRRKTEPTKDSAASTRSFSYTEAQYTRYLREQAPLETVGLDQYPPFASLLYQTQTSDYTAAASNLNRLCPQPQYWSPPPPTRTYSIESNGLSNIESNSLSNIESNIFSIESNSISTTSTDARRYPDSDHHQFPAARQSLLAALQAEVVPPVSSEEIQPSYDIDAFFRDFAQSLVESTDSKERLSLLVDKSETRNDCQGDTTPSLPPSAVLEHSLLSVDELNFLNIC